MRDLDTKVSTNTASVYQIAMVFAWCLVKFIPDKIILEAAAVLFSHFHSCQTACLYWEVGEQISINLTKCYCLLMLISQIDFKHKLIIFSAGMKTDLTLFLTTVVLCDAINRSDQHVYLEGRLKVT